MRDLFNDILKIEGARIPGTLTISDNDGAMIQITTERCWLNQIVPEDRFVLEAIPKIQK